MVRLGAMQQMKTAREVLEENKCRKRVLEFFEKSELARQIACKILVKAGVIALYRDSGGSEDCCTCENIDCADEEGLDCVAYFNICTKHEIEVAYFGICPKCEDPEIYLVECS